MNKMKRNLIIGFAAAPLILMCSMLAQSEVNMPPCGVLVLGGKGVQVIPTRGKVLTHFNENHPIECGSMVLTHQEAAWIKLSNQTVIKASANTFFEIPAHTGEIYRMYRGEVMVTAPPSGEANVWGTPNAEVEFKGGVFWLQYLAEDRRSTIGVFNRKVTFRNKFNSSASQTVATGEMSTISIRDERISPSQPAVMNHTRASEVLAHFAIPANEQQELVAIVQQVYEDRAKSLTSDIEDWHDEPVEPLSRGIASLPPTAKSAVDRDEASFTNRMMRERLFGGGMGPGPGPVRAPASSKKIIQYKDSELKVHEAKIKAETKRIEKEIENVE